MTDIAQLATVLPHDDALERRVLDIFMRMLDEAEYLIEYGTPNQKSNMIAKALPAMMRVLNQDENAQLQVLRTALEQLNSAELKSIGT